MSSKIKVDSNETVSGSGTISIPTGNNLSVAGTSTLTGNTNISSVNPPETANVPNIITGGLAQGKFLNWLEAKITNDNELAKPTLVYGIDKDQSKIQNVSKTSIEIFLLSLIFSKPK